MSLTEVQSTIPNPLTHDLTFVVYHTTTGQVLHVHRTLEHADHIEPAEVHKQQALRFAGPAFAAAAAVLELPTEQTQGRIPTRVDPTTQAIVWQAPPVVTAGTKRLNKLEQPHPH